MSSAARELLNWSIDSLQVMMGLASANYIQSYLKWDHCYSLSHSCQKSWALFWKLKASPDIHIDINQRQVLPKMVPPNQHKCYQMFVQVCCFRGHCFCHLTNFWRILVEHPFILPTASTLTSVLRRGQMSWKIRCACKFTCPGCLGRGDTPLTKNC